MVRTRIRTVPVTSGRAERVSGATVTSTAISEPYIRSVVTDSEGVRDGSFMVNHFDVVNATISHRYIIDPFRPVYKELINFTPKYFEVANGYTHLNDPNLPSNPSLGVLTLNRTNPSKPVVDIPVSLFELREIPSLVYSFGRRAFQRVADGHLRYEFGVKPVISDLFKLLDFKKDVDNRMRLLMKLQQGSLLRKVALYSSAISAAPGTLVTTNSSPPDFYCSHRLTTKVTNRTVWGYVRWTPDPVKFDLVDYPEERIRYLARRIVLGSSPDLSTLWNALPWSWLADWFGNMGDYLEAHRSLIPVNASTPRVCQTTVTEELFVLSTSNFGLSVGQHSCVRRLTTKSRVLAPASLPSADFPLLSGRQVGILASLAALRSR